MDNLKKYKRYSLFSYPFNWLCFAVCSRIERTVAEEMLMVLEWHQMGEITHLHLSNLTIHESFGTRVGISTRLDMDMRFNI